MSFFSQSGRPAESSNGSLSDILSTTAMKTELAIITALCSDAMRRDLHAIFEPIKQPPKPAGESLASEDLLVDFAEAPVLAIEGKGQDAARLERLDQADIQSARCQGLRRAAVTHFDSWQIDVLRRMGEVLSVRPDAVRKARADAKVRAEAAAKARRDKAYYDWANGSEGDSVDGSRGDDSDDPQILPEGFRAKIIDLPKDKRILVLDSVLLLLLSLEHYSAHSRVLMLNLTRVFHLPESTLVENESKVAEGLLSSAAAKTTADESTQRQASQDAMARKWKVGLATVAGAALLGVTGGLAAPILAAGIGGIMGGLGLGAVATLLGPLATNMVLLGGLFGAYGGKMTGGIVEKYEREIRDFKFLPVSRQARQGDTMGKEEEASGLAQLQDPEKRKAHKLRVAIGISGSVTDADDFVQPWTIFSPSRIEAFGLRWEMGALLQLGRKMSDVLRSVAVNFAGYQLLSMLVAGLWPFGLLNAAKTLDSPFAIAKTRSDKAGRILADALINKVQGVRPVTLVGYGLGARVIYACLLELAEHNAFGLVEAVVLMGAAVPSDAASWRRIRAVVSGGSLTCLARDDFVLGLLYRASSLQMGIAGVQKVVGVPGVENHDFTAMVHGHDKYKLLVGTILQRVGFGDLDVGVVARQHEVLKAVESEEKRRAKTEGANEDSALAREDADGRIIMVNDDADGHLTGAMEKTTLPQPVRDEREEEHEELEEPEHQIRMEDAEAMSMVDPEPEPDYGPDRETVEFGAGGRGFHVEWKSG